MTKLIVKFGYMKPNKKNRENFVEYIAKREGVIKNLNKVGNNPPTLKQSHLIEKLIKRYPETKADQLLEAFNKNKSIATATELITHFEEKILQESSSRDEYVQYIAERPRVVKEGTHGLFSSHDEPLVLQHVKETIKQNKGIIWTAIISLKREDAYRLGYDNLELWKTLIRSKQNELSTNLKIDSNNFQWYGAFHDEAHHPHVHLVMMSKDEKQGYLSKQSMIKIRSSFAREIFKDDLLHTYKKQTQYRDQLKLISKEVIQEKIQSINTSIKDDSKINTLFINLNHQLRFLPGKHTYGYLPKSLKAIVDEIVDELSKTEPVQALFDLWHEQRNEVLSTYSNKKEQIRHLSDINDFKPIKNIIIKEAKSITTLLTNSEIQVELDSPTQSTNYVDDLEVVNQDSFVIPVGELAEDSMINLIPLAESKVSKDHTNINQRSSLPTHSIRLLFQIGKLFETSMMNTAQNYSTDQKIRLKIRKQKIALGQHKDDSHKN